MAGEALIRRRIEAIKGKLHRLGDLRPGKVTEQYNVCGNPTCRCKADPPQKHGPYHQLNYTRKGKSRTEHVREQDLGQVLEQIRNYDRLRALIEEWIDLSIELDRLRRTAKR